jgi:hypothetical protein
LLYFRFIPGIWVPAFRVNVDRWANYGVPNCMQLNPGIRAVYLLTGGTDSMTKIIDSTGD